MSITLPIYKFIDKNICLKMYYKIVYQFGGGGGVAKRLRWIDCPDFDETITHFIFTSKQSHISIQWQI